MTNQTKIANLKLAEFYLKEMLSIETGTHILCGIDDNYLAVQMAEYKGKYYRIISKLSEAAISDNVILAQYKPELKATIVE